MNNKKLGTKFEQEMCSILAKEGYWVHFIVPDARGAQPFDLLAVKDRIPVAIDCKTCAADVFSISRLEQNQILAFERWLECGNGDPMIAVKHGKKIYMISYLDLKAKQKIKLERMEASYERV